MNRALALPRQAGPTAQAGAPASELGRRGQVLVQGEVEEVEHKLTEAENSRGQLRRFFTKFCTPVFLEAFVLTFLAGEQLHDITLSDSRKHSCVEIDRCAWK